MSAGLTPDERPAGRRRAQARADQTPATTPHPGGKRVALGAPSPSVPVPAFSFATEAAAAAVPAAGKRAARTPAETPIERPAEPESAPAGAASSIGSAGKRAARSAAVELPVSGDSLMPDLSDFLAYTETSERSGGKRAARAPIELPAQLVGAQRVEAQRVEAQRVEAQRVEAQRVEAQVAAPQPVSRMSEPLPDPVPGFAPSRAVTPEPAPVRPARTEPAYAQQPPAPAPTPVQELGSSEPQVRHPIAEVPTPTRVIPAVPAAPAVLAVPETEARLVAERAAAPAVAPPMSAPPRPLTEQQPEDVVPIAAAAPPGDPTGVSEAVREDDHRHSRVGTIALVVVTALVLVAGYGTLRVFTGDSLTRNAQMAVVADHGTADPAARPGAQAGVDPANAATTSTKDRAGVRGQAAKTKAAKAKAAKAKAAKAKAERAKARVARSAAQARAAKRTAATALPEDSGTGRRAVFDISAQRVWIVDEDDRVERTYPVSGSLTDNLQPGDYEVYSRSRYAVGIDDSGSMEYFVRFARGDRAAIGFHSIPEVDGEPVQSVDELGTPLSHGCIRQRESDALAMWDFAQLDTDVVVLA